MKQISVEVSTGTQSVGLQEVVVYNDNKLRIQIKSDSHDFQSYARVDVWAGGWTRVHSIPFNKMSTEKGLYYGRKINPRSAKDFKADRDELVRVAIKVLS